MFPRVKQVRHLGEYRLELTFTDGAKGELDFRERVVGRGGVFAPLQDIGFFKQVKVDPEAGTLIWPNEVDFCPDVLYSLVTGKPIRVERRAKTRAPRMDARRGGRKAAGPPKPTMAVAEPPSPPYRARRVR